MNTSDHVEFMRRLITLGELFDVKLSPARQALYFEALRDLPFEAVAGALNAAAKGCKFFPRPVEIRTFAQGDIEDLAESAWLSFRAAMRKLGYMASVSVRDAALGEAIVAVFGSWSSACTADLSPEMWASKRKEFGRVYRVMRQRNVEGGRYLVGMAEQQNAGRRDWLRFVPMGCIDSSGDIRRLTEAEGEAEREQLAVMSHEFSRLEAGDIAKRINATLSGDVE